MTQNIEAVIPGIILIPQNEVILEELREAAENNEGTQYFQQFYLKAILDYVGPYQAYSRAEFLLNKCKFLDVNAFTKIHKGGPYYWMGLAAFRMNDFQTATYFMDAAVSEDLRNDNNKLDTPAHLFIQLRGDQPAQAAKEQVELAESQMMRLINTYNSYLEESTIPDFSIDDLRNYFLLKSLLPNNKSWRSLATTLISFALEFDYRTKQMELIVNPSSNEMYLLHLFKGCVLLESLLKLNPSKKPSGNTLDQVLRSLYTNLGLSSSPTISTASFNAVLDLIKTTPKTISDAFNIAGKTRNTVGHFLGWDLILTRQEYEFLFENIGVACLHVISTLYR